MDRLERLKQKALEKAMKSGKPKNINEGMVTYSEGVKERMHPNLVRQLRERNHSLGAHPCFPDSDERHFEEKIMSKRFDEVLKNYKRRFDVEEVTKHDVMVETMRCLGECMKMESKHKDSLEKLAVEMIMKEYDITDDDVEIIAELVDKEPSLKTQKNPSPVRVEDIQFENHESIKSANDEVYKRRLVNSMIQGAAKKSSHMFHLVDQELSEMNPRLPDNYAKLMAAADYAYLVNDDAMPTKVGGVVNVEFPQEEGGKPKIHAQAMTFPVLVHELVKGIMEILSSHGLPEDRKLAEYVMGKADFVAAENWDMRMGPSIWECFTEMIEADDFNLKHHIYADLVAKPVNEFNRCMKEILAGTKEGKRIIGEIVREIKRDMERDDYNEAMKNLGEDAIGLDELDGIDFDL